MKHVVLSDLEIKYEANRLKIFVSSAKCVKRAEVIEH